MDKRDITLLMIMDSSVFSRSHAIHRLVLKTRIELFQYINLELDFSHKSPKHLNTYAVTREKSQFRRRIRDDIALIGFRRSLIMKSVKTDTQLPIFLQGYTEHFAVGRASLKLILGMV